MAQVRMNAINRANANIDRTIDVAEDILLQLDIARRVTAPIDPLVVEWNFALIPPYCGFETAK